MPNTEVNELPVHVAAAVIRRSDGAVLLGLRSADADKGDLWEFPGGKLERNERQIDALARELREELGIGIERATPLIRLLHQYPDKQVDLEVLEVAEWTGEPVGREGQEIRWVDPSQLSSFHFPAANVPVTTALNLPKIALVTPPLGGDVTAFLDDLERCLAAGIKLVQLRLKSDRPGVSRQVNAQSVSLCNQYGSKLVINGVVDDVALADAHGLHLNSRRLLQLSERPLGDDLLLSTSCHNVGELQHAERLGADYIYVSPVFETPSHPQAEPLGWNGLQRLVKRAKVPVYALGGLGADDARFALRAGCQGIAMIRGLWNNADPKDVIDACRTASLASAYEIGQIPQQ